MRICDSQPCPPLPEPAFRNEKPSDPTEKVSQPTPLASLPPRIRDFCAPLRSVSETNMKPSELQFPSPGKTATSGTPSSPHIQAESITRYFNQTRQALADSMTPENMARLSPENRTLLENRHRALEAARSLLHGRAVEMPEDQGFRSAYEKVISELGLQFDRTDSVIRQALTEPGLSPERRSELEEMQKFLAEGRNRLAQGQPLDNDFDYGGYFAKARDLEVSNPFPVNDDHEILDIHSLCQVKNFLNTYTQIDHAIAQSQGQAREQAENQCTSASLVAAALLMSDQNGNRGLGALIDVVLSKTEKQSVSAEDKAFLEGMKERIGRNGVTRGDIERLQSIISTSMANGHEKGLFHRTTMDQVREYIKDSAFYELMTTHDLDLESSDSSNPDFGGAHTFLRMGKDAYFDPWPRHNGQIVTDPAETELYRRAEQRCVGSQDSTRYPLPRLRQEVCRLVNSR